MASSKAEPMAPVDTAWLRMDDPTNLMMITGVFVLDRILDFERLKRLLEHRLLYYPRFRQRVININGAGPPKWQLDPYFDLRYHMRRIALPSPGDRNALQELVSDLMSTPLDMGRPLWQWHLVEGYDGKCALVCRVHHSIADGIALVRVLLAMTDETPDAPEPEPEPQPERHPPGVVESLIAPARAVVEETIGATERLVGGGVELLTKPTQALDLSKPLAVVSAVGKLALLSAEPRTLFKGRLGVAKRCAWSSQVTVEQVKAVGRVMGGTINDVLMTAVTGALRRYMQHHGAPVDGLDLRAVIPVNLRPPTQSEQLGNRFGLVFLSLPVGVDEPIDRLLVLKDRMEEIKHSAEAVVAFGILNAMGYMHPAMHGTIVEIFASKSTLVMTNVPGPREPLYLAGVRIEDIMFWVPQSGRLGLGVSIFSYAGKVLVGIATDTGLVPDPEAMVAEFEAEFAQMLEQVYQIDGFGIASTTAALTEAATAAADVSAAPDEAVLVERADAPPAPAPRRRVPAKLPAVASTNGAAPKRPRARVAPPRKAPPSA